MFGHPEVIITMEAVEPQPAICQNLPENGGPPETMKFFKVDSKLTLSDLATEMHDKPQGI
ncbi:hypothetical protein HNQ92_004826 [Rhabdobacter roseus]|uniref:Uncharacterized protein n=1 Tax=Rhabdobacter roseus TaxID=1655419 RepID=A0A840TUT4_9BACT|nr:hypothetical protein [Rhabdobacter roseus]